MANTTNSIDRTKIKVPEVVFTEKALNELKLIIENDFTLAGKYFRIVISGKGCDGFTYSAGFTDLNEEDFLIKINEELSIIVDPFAAFYLANVAVDFVLDPINDLEGFVITNNNQNEFAGKFWKKAPEKTPPMTQTTGAN